MGKKKFKCDNDFENIGFEGLESFEEINSYTLIESAKRKGKLISKEVHSGDGQKIKKKKKKKKTKKALTENKIIEVPKEQKNKREHSPESKLDVNKRHKVTEESIDVTAWRSICTPEEIIENLKLLGFMHPTPIQKYTIPVAISSKKDIVGAAETGSGKTLAFMIPIVTRILEEKEKRKNSSNYNINDKSEENPSLFSDDFNDNMDTKPDIDEENSDIENTEEFSNNDSGVDETGNDSNNSDEFEKSDLENENFENLSENFESDDESEMTDKGIGCVKVQHNVEFDFLPKPSVKPKFSTLRALIVTPTRELAVQIQKHTEAILKNTGIRCVTVIGGMSQEKQERLLNYHPEIVIGTPGRLWEMFQMGNEHLKQLDNIKYLAIDETDRLMERGKFEELQNLLGIINGDPESKKRRQNFVFSATLTLTHALPERLKNKSKKVKEITSEMKLNKLMKVIGVRQRRKVVDITGQTVTADALSEAKIFCDETEKDSYLYYFLNCFPGRTLVFSNSINCVKRLSNLLSLLNRKPLILHAMKQQKQRLTALEKFRKSPVAVLVSTDVAARGIDIPCVDHIVHYEVPHTAEIYVHRSGRTARADKEGLSVLLIGNKETGRYRKLCATLKRTSPHPSFPVNEEILDQCRNRVQLAQDIESSQFSLSKKNQEDDWIQKMAVEADMVESGSEDDEISLQRAVKNKKIKSELNKKKAILNSLLSVPLSRASFSAKYPTSTGKLIMPEEFTFKKSDAALDLFKTKTKSHVKIPAFKNSKKKRKKKVKNIK